MTERRESSHSCPYAIALHDDMSESDDEAVTRNCPAFANHSCPFKDKSPDEVRETLLQIPASHYSPSGKFYKVLQEIHQVRPVVQEDVFTIPGGCPVQNLVPKQGLSFRAAMEDLSLSAVMARLAQEMEDDSERTEDELEVNQGDENAQAQLSGESDTAIEKPLIETTSKQVESTKSVSSKRTSLSASLKTGTAVSHQAAENVYFVKNFIRGIIDRNLYGKLVVMLYYVYDKLEECLDRNADNNFGSCHFPRELYRTSALKDDLDFWFGDDLPPMTPATRDYVARLDKIADTDPLLLLSHAYTRYLGDLSGGRVLSRVARRAMQLGEDGLAFYEFPEIKSLKLFKDKYRQALDELPLSDEQIQKLVREANVAFCLNMRLFEELDVEANVPGASVRPLEDALAFGDATVDEGSLDEKCPFMMQPKVGAEVGDGVPVTNGRCPWPFILAHDPKEGMKDWQTWLVIGMVFTWIWSRVVQYQARA